MFREINAKHHFPPSTWCLYDFTHLTGIIYESRRVRNAVLCHFRLLSCLYCWCSTHITTHYSDWSIFAGESNFMQLEESSTISINIVGCHHKVQFHYTDFVCAPCKHWGFISYRIQIRIPFTIPKSQTKERARNEKKKVEIRFFPIFFHDLIANW